MRILCTGATGFVGRHLLDRLAQDDHQVIPVVRREQSALPEAVTLTDFRSETEWGKVLRGAEAVCHLAAIAHASGVREEEIRRVNVDATVALARASLTEGVRRFLFLSSVKAVAEENDPESPLSESAECHPEDAYGRAKADAERELWRLREEMDIVIMRPPLVYGAGVKGNFLNLMRLVERGVPMPLKSVDNCRSFVYVENLVDAIARVITRSDGSQRYHVSDGQDFSTPELLNRTAVAMGRRARLFAFPPQLLEAVGSAVGMKPLVRRLTRSLTLDPTQIIRQAGWSPPYTSDEGLRRTVEWFCSAR